MKVRVSDYIANYIVEKGIKNVFTVVGGGSMYLNDSFGHNPNLHCLYNHHEQASAMAAEGFARVNNVPAVVCVTSGPGAINALNGVVGAYQDSIPMMIFSGQVKTSLLVKTSGLKLRTLGPQEFDIVSALDNMTKYAETILDPSKIRYYLEKAYYIATTGRKGPTWLDIPLDVQSAYVETELLEQYHPERELNHLDRDEVKIICEKLVQKMKEAMRPIICAGNGIRLSGRVDLLKEIAEVFKIPIVTCWDSIDLIESDNMYYTGRSGTMGDRAGNFAVQNCDLLIAIGTRLNIYQVGYDVKTWAREAYVAVVDIDSEELKKKTVRIDLPICADAGIFMEQLLDCYQKNTEGKVHDEWLKKCNDWKERYPVVSEKQKEIQNPINVYAFVDELGRKLPKGMITIASNGSASVVGSQAYYIGEGNRFLMNCGISSMGYGLPAAIGACVANENKPVVCLEGDGSIMMNIQELQTIVTNELPIKIFIINNLGYHQIRQTQSNIFNNGLIGVGPESSDLGFPNFGKIADAFGIVYDKIETIEDFNKIQSIIACEMPVLCEVYVSTTQMFEPKSTTKKLDNGILFSPPLEDMAPFLPREELRNNMVISLVDEFIDNY